jgi:threonine dehydrogenase-like Zn-dependent dehydrogenase
VLIMGAGPIGLVTLLAARAFGASEIAITDLDHGRLALAAAVAPGVVTVDARGKGVSRVDLGCRRLIMQWWLVECGKRP